MPSFRLMTPNVYWSLLHTIAGGVNRITEIAGRMRMAASQLTRYLAVLQDMGLVHRRVSVTESNPARSKRGIYEVTDPFVRLWYGCVAPFESLLEFGRQDTAETLMHPRLVAHLSWAYEEACRQYAEDHAHRYGAIRCGRYWDRSREIDVAGVDETGRVVFAGECKWCAKPLDLSVARALERNVQAAWPKWANAIHLHLFCAAGFTPAVKKWAAEKNAELIDCKKLCNRG